MLQATKAQAMDRLSVPVMLDLIVSQLHRPAQVGQQLQATRTADDWAVCHCHGLYGIQCFTAASLDTGSGQMYLQGGHDAGFCGGVQRRGGFVADQQARLPAHQHTQVSYSLNVSSEGAGAD